jgi:hypothetical protein
MRTTKYPAYPIRELISSQQPLGLHDLALAVYPLGLYGVQPRTLLGQKTTDDPHSSFAAALLEFSVVSSEPAHDLLGDVPGSVVPEMRSMAFFPAASSFSQLHSRNWVVIPLTGFPSTNLSHVSIEFWQIKSVAGDGLRLLRSSLAIEFWTRRRGFPSSLQLLTRICCGHAHQSVAPPFFPRTEDRGR